jgi:GT2 family glycosyltransferase
MIGFAEGDNHQTELEALRHENARLRATVYAVRRELDAIHCSTSWRLTAPLRMARYAVDAARRWRLGSSVSLALDEDGYRQWLRLDDDDRQRRAPGLKTRLTSAKPARVSVLMVVHDDPAKIIDTTVAALRAQYLHDWQLCIVDAASTAAHVAGMLAALTDDPRIRVRRQDKPAFAMAQLAAWAMSNGDLIGLLHPGECLSPDALAEFALLFHDQPKVALAYADEDRIDEAGRRSEPRFKGGWSPDLLLADPRAIGRPWVMRRSVLDAAGGFIDRFEGAEEYDLLLRTARLLALDRVAHLPRVLMHTPPPVRTSTTGAAMAALEAARFEDPGARLLRQPDGHWFEWSHRPACVSVIIPTRDRSDLLAAAAAAVLAEEGVELELLIVDNDSQEDETARLFAKLREDPRVRILSMPGPFNWSVLNNAAAAQARGDVLLLLNNDIAAIDKNWLAPLAAEAMRPAIGIVGGQLFYPDDTVQHAGIWFGRGGVPLHLLRHAERDDMGYLGQLALPHNLLAVTGACLAIRRAVFDEIGGLDDRFPVAFNDVDLCLRSIQAGYRVLWTPHIRLRHLEAASRGDPGSGARQPAEQQAFAQFRDLWGARIGHDPYFNANLDIGASGRLTLVHPPRPA